MKRLKKDVVFGNQYHIFTLGANDGLVNEVVSLLGCSISPVQISKFSDGEHFDKAACDVCGSLCFVIHSTHFSGQDSLIDLFIFLDSLKRASPKRIFVICPYFGYSRQDRKIELNDPISGLLMARLLQTSGADEIACVDFHSQTLFNSFPLDHFNLSTGSLFRDVLEKELITNGISSSSLCFVSPDKGGISRAQKISSQFPGSSFAFAEKIRPIPNKSFVKSVFGNVRGKICVVVDDIVDTAGTLIGVASELADKGAVSVWAIATHGIFSGEAKRNIALSKIDKLFVSNSIEPQPSGSIVVSIAPLISQYISSRLIVFNESH